MPIHRRFRVFSSSNLAPRNSLLCAKIGFLVLAVGDELMEVQNPAGFEPRRW